MKELFSLPINIQIRLWGSFMNRITSSAILPFIAIYLTEETGQVFTSYYLISIVIMSFVVNLYAGYICDRLPRKKMLVSLSIIEVILLFLMTLTVIFDYTKLFLAVYVLAIIASIMRRPNLTALLQDSVTEDTKRTIYNLDYWLFNLSIAIGALLGGALYTSHKELLFILLTLSALLLSILYSVFIKEDYSKIVTTKNRNVLVDLIGSYKETFQNKSFILLTLGVSLLLSAQYTLSTYIAVRLANEFSFKLYDIGTLNGVQMFSFINILNAVLVLCLTFYIGRKIKESNLKYSIILGLACFTLGYTILFGSNNFVILILAVSIATIGEIISFPIINSEQIKLIPPNKRGSYAAITGLGRNFSDFIAKASLAVGFYLSTFQMTFLFFGLLLLGSCLITINLFVHRVSDEYQIDV